MTEYAYKIKKDNYTENITFNLKKGDVLKITSSKKDSTGYGICGNSSMPYKSIADWEEITGVTVDSKIKVLYTYFYNITITSNNVNKNFRIIIYSQMLSESQGGTITINIINDISNIKIKINNSYINGVPKIKINGNWTDGSAYVKIDGSWRN